jgi:hypothetical protein
MAGEKMKNRKRATTVQHSVSSGPSKTACGRDDKYIIILFLVKAVKNYVNVMLCLSSNAN